MVTNCKNCGLPIFHGAAGYAGAQCRCGFSAKPNYDHNALTELLKERDQLKADSEVVTGLAESRLAENLRLMAEKERLAAMLNQAVSEGILLSDQRDTLRKQLDEARELLAVASEIIHEQAIHIDRPMTDLGSEALTRLDDWLGVNKV